ncbi:hypothetical protein ACE38W_10605 [Chitinophaga sp. Hz27]|uniref:hypothetical protein n=1 Tax=Chitinophaga sp. Hz27 TaxID=3347169 RepID=UPI0035DB15B4
MKKSVTLILMLLAVCIFSSCRKNDNPKLPDGIEDGVLPKFTQTAGDEDLSNVATFTSTFKLESYFPNALKPSKVDIVVAINGDYTNVKTIAAGITSLPVASTTVTGAQILQLFGVTAADVEVLEIGADCTLPDGKVSKAFPYYIDSNGHMQTITPYAQNAYSLPGSNPELYYQVP